VGEVGSCGASRDGPVSAVMSGLGHLGAEAQPKPLALTRGVKWNLFFERERERLVVQPTRRESWTPVRKSRDACSDDTQDFGYPRQFI